MALASAISSRSAADCAAAAVAALERALAVPEGAVTAATETEVQTALYKLRLDPGQAALVAELQQVAASLRILAEAKRRGRTNLYASRLARLRRMCLAPAPHARTHR
jgi:hypothetical protein